MPDELYACDECGRMFTLDDLYPWEPPRGDTRRVCGECYDDLEMEL